MEWKRIYNITDCLAQKVSKWLFQFAAWQIYHEVVKNKYQKSCHYIAKSSFNLSTVLQMQNSIEIQWAYFLLLNLHNYCSELG